MAEKNFERFYRDLGPTLKRIRMEKKITQVELGALSGKPQSSIARLESGAVPDVTLRVLYELLAAMGVSLTEVVSELEGKKIPEIPKSHSAQTKKWESINKQIEAMDDKSRNWALQIFENILNPPGK